MKAKIKIKASGNVYDATIDEDGTAWFCTPNAYLHAWRFEYDVLEELEDSKMDEDLAVVTGDVVEEDFRFNDDWD